MRYFPQTKQRMICKKCGHELPEGVKFCGVCGSQIESESSVQTNNHCDTQTNTQNNTQTSKNYANQTPQSNNSEFASPSFEQDNSDSKKASSKKKTLRNILAIGLPILAALLVFFNWDSIVGFCIKTFGSDADYFKYVESKTIEDSTGTVSSFLSNISFNPKQASTTKVECTISDELINIAKKNGVPKDALETMEWLKDVTFTADCAFDGEKSQLNFSSDARDNKLATGKMIVDFDSGKAYLSVPELSEDVLVSEFDMNGIDMPADYSQYTAIMSEFNDILPEESVFNDLVEKYLETALDTIEDVSSESKDIKIGSIEEECTVLEFAVDSYTLFDMGEAILEEAKDDEEIKNFLKNYVKLIKKYNPEIPDVDIAHEYADAINELLSELKASRKNAKNEDLFILCDYVVDHRVVGRSVKVEGKEVFRYLTLHDGDDFAFEFVVPNSFEIRGQGTNDNDIVTASYDLISSNQTIFTINVSDFDIGKFKEGYLCGKIKITPNNELFKQVIPAIADLSPSIEIISNHSENNIKLELNIYSNGVKMLGISSDTDYGKKPDIKLPSNNLTGNSSEWSDNLDFDILESALKKSGAPDIIIDSIDELRREDSDSYDSYYYY